MNGRDKVRGKFITLEGQDGAGKSTNLAVIAEVLREHNIAFIETREPGGTDAAEQIRQLILDSKDSDFGDLTELLLVFAARADHIEKKIGPALKTGTWVLCDRFTDATFAYQGGGRGMGMQNIKQLQQLVQGTLQPDLTVLLDLPISIGEERATQRSSADRFERQASEFKQRVRDAYLKIAADEPERVKVIDASASITDVAKSVRQTLESFINA